MKIQQRSYKPVLQHDPVRPVRPIPLGYKLVRLLTSLKYNYRGRDRLFHALCRPDGTDRPFEVRWQGLKYQGNLNNVIDQAMFFYGGHAKSELALLERIGRFLKSRERRFSFLDVGTNVGTHALFMAARSDRVVGFEPVNELRLRALQNISINRLDNVQILDCALGSETGVADIYCSESRNIGCNSLVPDFAADNSTTGRRVPVRRGDEVVAELGLRDVRVVKVDVEGFEPQVCDGLKETLMRDRPFILLELWKFNLPHFDQAVPFPDCLYRGCKAYELIGKNNGAYRLASYTVREHRGTGQAEVLIVPDEWNDFMANNSFCKYLP